jgi:hypothetical protein
MHALTSDLFRLLLSVCAESQDDAVQLHTVLRCTSFGDTQEGSSLVSSGFLLRITWTDGLCGVRWESYRGQGRRYRWLCSPYKADLFIDIHHTYRMAAACLMFEPRTLQETQQGSELQASSTCPSVLTDLVLASPSRILTG